MGAVVDHHLGAQFGQIFHNGLANAAVAPSHDGDLTLKKIGKGFEGVGIGCGHGARSTVEEGIKPKLDTADGSCSQLQHPCTVEPDAEQPIKTAVTFFLSTLVEQD